MKIILFFYEILQNFVGFNLLCYLWLANSITRIEKEKGRLFVRCSIGVSLGYFVFYTDKLFSKEHEYGHSIQSMYLGWLYLLIVGIPSVIRNILCRLNPCKKNRDELYLWYYSGYPERWADILGDIRRR